MHFTELIIKKDNWQIQFYRRFEGGILFFDPYIKTEVIVVSSRLYNGC